MPNLSESHATNKELLKLLQLEQTSIFHKENGGNMLSPKETSFDILGLELFIAVHFKLE